MIDCLARLLGQFKPDRLTGFLLPHRCTFHRIPIWRDVLHLEGDNITAAELAIDCEIEHREVSNPSFDLELRSY
jgi:hypothetical protein